MRKDNSLVFSKVKIKRQAVGSTERYGQRKRVEGIRDFKGV